MEEEATFCLLEYHSCGYEVFWELWAFHGNLGDENQEDFMF